MKQSKSSLQPIMIAFVVTSIITQAIAQPTLIGDTLDRVTKYFSAASSLFIRVAQAFEGDKFKSLNLEQKLEIIDRTSEILPQIDRQIQTNMPLPFYIDEYAESANRADQFLEATQTETSANENLERIWKELQIDFNKVSRVVRITYDLVEERRESLKVLLTDEETAALRDVLLARMNILSTLADLPPPKTETELLKLRAMARQYRNLIVSLKRLRVSLETARARMWRGE